MQLIISAGLYIGPLVIFVLLTRSQKGNTNNIFLAFSLFCIWYGLLLNDMHISRKILNFPYLIRTGNIFAFLIFPFLYIYIRNTFYPGKWWHRTDFLLLIPSFFYLIDMFPFIFLTPAVEKIAVTKANLSDLNRLFTISEGWISIRGFHFVARYVFSIVLLTLCIVMIFQNRDNTRLHHHTKVNKPLLFTITLVLLYIPILVPGIYGVVFRKPWFNLNFVSASLSLTLISVLVFLIFSPEVLYGYLSYHGRKGSDSSPDRKHPQLQTEKQPLLATPEVVFQVDEIICQINTFMENQKPYLQSGYMIHDLSKDTSIPVYQVSYAINHHYNMRFSSWLNHHRINQFLQLVNEKHHLTMEALAKEVGFSNRITFINAFKREKGVSPREYLKSEHS